jgi:cytidyltransferase-like protein
MEFSGAGSQALAWLHAVGGSSRTILEASDRYSMASLIDTVGFTPERFTSPEVSRSLAQLARERARSLAEPATPVFGVGASATIATDRTKRGEHRCVVATSNSLGLLGYKLTLEKGLRDRAAEEDLVSRIILLAIADSCGLLAGPYLELSGSEKLVESFEPAPATESFIAGAEAALLIGPDGSLAHPEPGQSFAMLSGSFNPVHAGHLELAATAAQHLGQRIVFEMPLINADKPAVDLHDAQRRAAQFLGRGSLLLTRAPLFIDKARLFPRSTFVVGADTALRLLDSRFYQDGGRDASLAELQELGARFLVAGRHRDNRFLTLEDMNIPDRFRSLFSELPESTFRIDLSSSQLRQERYPARGESSGGKD